MPARLTDTAVRNAKPREKAYKLTDGGSLFLLVTPTGSKLWRYRYRLAGAENLFAVGEYPAMGVQQAREARDAARRLVKEGIHPAQHRRASRLVTATEAANTFEAVAREWIEQNRAHWSAYYARQVETVLTGDVFPEIGGLPIRAVTSAQVLAILKEIEKRGAPSIALLVRQWVSAIYRYAVATLRADVDPASALRGAVRKPKTQHKRPLTKKELALFLAKLEESQSGLQVSTALHLLLLTFVRPGEVRGARWKEFDLDAAEWRIPAERMKMREPHIVPLSRQAVRLLRTLREETGNRPQLFPNARDPKRDMSPTTLNRALERMGYAGHFSAHGFRATASTLLNEMGYRPDVIERQLAHRERNRVRASYNQASYMAERKKMMQDWANFLDALERGDNVTPIRSKKAK
ncbi:tyrosine-type recombinase/integrase [bacterium BD-1]|nr:tyrosine-type recombinase/integrase [Ottowia caeni]